MRLHRMERCHGEYNLGFLHCEKRLLSTVEAEIYRCPLGNAVRKKRTKETSDKRQQDMDQTFMLDMISNDIKENVSNSFRGMPELKAYVTTLNKHKQQMSAMIENIIKTVNSSQEENRTDIHIWEKTSGKPSKSVYGVPLIVEPLTMHDVSHIVNDAFRDHLCRELPGNQRKLFNSLELKEHLSLIEDIRRAEKDVMEVQERLLRVGDKGASNDDISVRKKVYGIHSEMRRLRLGLNKERRMLNSQYCQPKIVRKLPILNKSVKSELFVNTNIVKFNRFVLGGIYKKTVIITNLGDKMMPFKLLTSNLSLFQYDYKPRCPLAPGMNAKLTITFKCTSMEDKYELITLMTIENKQINILVGAENVSPILHYTLECYDDMKPKYCKKLAFHKPSNVCLFECNACLVGARKTTIVKIKNVGRSSKFILVPEDVWYTKPVEVSTLFL
ncbi:hypothetical protein ACI65C_009396 [Semiaphis heraclei]